MFGQHLKANRFWKSLRRNDLLSFNFGDQSCRFCCCLPGFNYFPWYNIKMTNPRTDWKFIKLQKAETNDDHKRHYIAIVLKRRGWRSLHYWFGVVCATIIVRNSLELGHCLAEKRWKQQKVHLVNERKRLPMKVTIRDAKSTTWLQILSILIVRAECRWNRIYSRIIGAEWGLKAKNLSFEQAWNWSAGFKSGFTYRTHDAEFNQKNHKPWFVFGETKNIF